MPVSSLTFEQLLELQTPPVASAHPPTHLVNTSLPSLPRLPSDPDTTDDDVYHEISLPDTSSPLAQQARETARSTSHVCTNCLTSMQSAVDRAHHLARFLSFRRSFSSLSRVDRHKAANALLLASISCASARRELKARRPSHPASGESASAPEMPSRSDTARASPGVRASRSAAASLRAEAAVDTSQRREFHYGRENPKQHDNSPGESSQRRAGRLKAQSEVLHGNRTHESRFLQQSISSEVRSANALASSSGQQTKATDASRARRGETQEERITGSSPSTSVFTAKPTFRQKREAQSTAPESPLRVEDEARKGATRSATAATAIGGPEQNCCGSPAIESLISSRNTGNGKINTTGEQQKEQASGSKESHVHHHHHHHHHLHHCRQRCHQKHYCCLKRKKAHVKRKSLQ